MLQKDAATANGNVWAKIRTLSGEEGYVAQRYLVESNKEYDTVDFTGFDIPATINSESQLECTVEGSNYILGPINVTKNNDYIYNVDVKVKIETNDEEDPWDEIVDEKEVEKKIEEEVKEDFIREDNII